MVVSFLQAASPLAGVASARLSALLIVQARRRWSRLNRQGDLQAVHRTPTPRLGGLAVFAALLVGLGLTDSPLGWLLMLPFIPAPVGAGGGLHDQPRAAALALGAFFALFFATSALGMRWASRRTRGMPRAAVLAVR